VNVQADHVPLLATATGIAAVVGLLMASGDMCPKCGYGTRTTSKRWSKCKRCGERVERKRIMQ
jgi:tRNA(Ile2) C34 agmatinyltransferase TiaS